MKVSAFVFKGKDLLYICIALLLFFQIYLQKISAPFQYFDELIAVICLVRIVIEIINGHFRKKERNDLIIICFIAVVGICSNYIAGIQKNVFPILMDIGNTFKVFVTYMGSILFLKGRDKKKITEAIACIVKVYVTIAFIFMILHELNIVVMGRDVRYGINSFRFINDVAGQLSLMFYFILLILTLDINYHGKKNKLNVFIVMALIVWTSTLRTRAILYVLIYLFLYWVITKKNGEFRFSFRKLLMMGGFLVLGALDQFETYFANTATARSHLLRYGIYTMQRYFPMGSGFATYGTDAAVTFYSNLYIEYGFQNVYGLSKGNAMFAHDTYWPAIMAQFGIVGFALMVILIWRLFKDLLYRSRNNKISYFMAIFICITQVSASLVTATFFHFVTVALFFVIPLIFVDEEKLEGKT